MKTSFCLLLTLVLTLFLTTSTRAREEMPLTLGGVSVGSVLAFTTDSTVEIYAFLEPEWTLNDLGLELVSAPNQFPLLANGVPNTSVFRFSSTDFLPLDLGDFFIHHASIPLTVIPNPETLMVCGALRVGILPATSTSGGGASSPGNGTGGSTTTTCLCSCHDGGGSHSGQGSTHDRRCDRDYDGRPGSSKDCRDDDRDGRSYSSKCGGHHHDSHSSYGRNDDRDCRNDDRDGKSSSSKSSGKYSDSYSSYGKNGKDCRDDDRDGKSSSHKGGGRDDDGRSGSDCRDEDRGGRPYSGRDCWRDDGGHGHTDRCCRCTCPTTPPAPTVQYVWPGTLSFPQGEAKYFCLPIADPGSD